MPRMQEGEPRVLIADAALRLIARDGIAALRTATLARELGVTGGALYRHFASREAILIAAAARARWLLEQDLPSPSQGEPWAVMEAFVKARVGTAREHLGVVRLVTSEQLAKAMPPEAVAELRAAVEATRRFFIEALAQGQRRGEIRADIPAEALVVVVMGTVQLMVLRASGWDGEGALSPPWEGGWSTLRRLLAPLGEAR
jgi:TetR/AcrR family transcriptional regulator